MGERVEEFLVERIAFAIGRLLHVHLGFEAAPLVSGIRQFAEAVRQFHAAGIEFETLGVTWIAGNGKWIALAGSVRWIVSGLETLDRNRWYLVTANHQSWVDIFVLQKVLSGRIPLLKFFLKRELIRIPLIGLAWWALDFPFMRRHSEEFLRAHPERRGDDLAAIRRSCEKFALIPTSVMNFAEGTRFTKSKKADDPSPYRHLLRPRSGGLALALNAMGEQFHSLLDVTLFYPGGAPTLFDLLSGRMKAVVVRVHERPIPDDLRQGDYANDPGFRTRMQAWVHELWAGKDRELESLRLELIAG